MRLIYSFIMFAIVSLSSVSVANEIRSVFDSTDTENRLEMLENAIQALQRKLTDNVNTTSSTFDSNEPTKQSASTYTQLEDIRQQLRSIRGEVEQLQFENSKLNERMVKFAADIEFRLNELNNSKIKTGKNEISQDIAEKSAPGKILGTETDSQTHPNKQEDEEAKLPKQQGKTNVKDTNTVKEVKKVSKDEKYKEALSSFKSKNYKTAAELFQSFVKDHPDDNLAGDAYYWLGEINFLQAEYNKAAAQYLKGYQANPTSSHAADSLLKLSRSLAKLNKRKEACASLSKLHKDFPRINDDIKKQIRSDSKALRCVL